METLSTGQIAFLILIIACIAICSAAWVVAKFCKDEDENPFNKGKKI